MTRSLRALHDNLGRTPLFDWGRFRWYEGLVSAFYVHERTREPWLLDLARLLRAQGVDFPALYRTEDVTVPTPRRGLWKWTKHVVNTAMATKAAALSFRLDGREEDRAFARAMIELLDRHHGQANGMFSGDECLAGKNPLQGTELCAVVELLYSLETLFSVFADPWFADRLERVAWNALPATFAPDMWSHQYDQQANQVQCTINPDHLFTTNGPESNLDGLEPNFGCCTANMHQGWPKLAAHLWMKTRDEGLVAAAWAPCRASFTSRGVPVSVRVETDYPFRETIAVTVRPDRPASFPLEVRPTTPWNYGLVVDPRRPEASIAFEERPVGERPFSPEGAGVVARAKGRRLVAWKLQHGWAGEVSRADPAWAHPPRPDPVGPLEAIELLPYGCTNIRITEFPQLDPGDATAS